MVYLYLKYFFFSMLLKIIVFKGIFFFKNVRYVILFLNIIVRNKFCL